MIKGRQPICKGTNANGELVWGSKPVPKWQKALVSVAVRLAGAMCPGIYKGDFGNHWAKIKDLWAQQGMEYECDSMTLRSSVIGPVSEKYEEAKKRRRSGGD